MDDLELKLSGTYLGSNILREPLVEEDGGIIYTIDSGFFCDKMVLRGQPILFTREASAIEKGSKPEFDMARIPGPEETLEARVLVPAGGLELGVLHLDSLDMEFFYDANEITKPVKTGQIVRCNISETERGLRGVNIKLTYDINNRFEGYSFGSRLRLGKKPLRGLTSRTFVVDSFISDAFRLPAKYSEERFIYALQPMVFKLSYSGVFGLSPLDAWEVKDLMIDMDRVAKGPVEGYIYSIDHPESLQACQGMVCGGDHPLFGSDVPNGMVVRFEMDGKEKSMALQKNQKVTYRIISRGLDGLRAVELKPAIGRFSEKIKDWDIDPNHQESVTLNIEGIDARLYEPQLAFGMNKRSRVFERGTRIDFDFYTSNGKDFGWNITMADGIEDSTFNGKVKTISLRKSYGNTDLNNIAYSKSIEGLADGKIYPYDGHLPNGAYVSYGLRKGPTPREFSLSWVRRLERDKFPGDVKEKLAIYRERRSEHNKTGHP
ncbi:hypothetical protein JXB31_02095 [Candidatus Woesearchaeota archaeon]|nr:hypothetical protein [Candidatus Woesearchaeota archaeon]